MTMSSVISVWNDVRWKANSLYSIFSECSNWFSPLFTPTLLDVMFYQT